MGRSLVLIDNCAWDELMRRGVDLALEQGADLQFSISIYGHQEIPPADHEREEARATGQYIREQMNAAKIQPAQWFALGDLESETAGAGLGSLEPDGSVTGGGYMTSVQGRAFVSDEKSHKKIGGASGTKRQGSGLLKNQTDVDYGEWAFSVPLVTLNIKDFHNSIMIIDLNMWTSGNFGEFIRNELTKFDNR